MARGGRWSWWLQCSSGILIASLIDLNIAVKTLTAKSAFSAAVASEFPGSVTSVRSPIRFINDNPPPTITTWFICHKRTQSVFNPDVNNSYGYTTDIFGYHSIFAKRYLDARIIPYPYSTQKCDNYFNQQTRIDAGLFKNSP